MIRPARQRLDMHRFSALEKNLARLADVTKALALTQAKIGSQTELREPIHAIGSLELERRKSFSRGTNTPRLSNIGPDAFLSELADLVLPSSLLVRERWEDSQTVKAFSCASTGCAAAQSPAGMLVVFEGPWRKHCRFSAKTKWKNTAKPTHRVIGTMRLPGLSPFMLCN